MSDPGNVPPRKTTNFELALGALQRFIAEAARSEAVEAGIVQAFEFTFEQSWKLLQARARCDGLEVSTPRASVGAGLKLGLIQDEALWLDMLAARNLASHTYHAQLARDLVRQVEERYLPAFLALHAALRASPPGA